MSALRISLLLGAALVGTAAFAQSNMGVPNAVQGFSVNRDQPIQIEAVSLEIRDKESIATFTGNVHVIQGDTHMRSQTLKVLYDQDAGKDGGKAGNKSSGNKAGGNKVAGSGPAARPASAATPGPSGQQQIQRLEASGGVIVTQKDQTATGDQGIFDTKSNSVTLIGNVVVKQGESQLKGDRLVVNLETGVSRMDVSPKGGRIQGTFMPPQQQQQQPAPAPPAAGRQTPAPKPRTN